MGLIEGGWRAVWCKWSVRFAVLAGVIAAGIVSNPKPVLELLNSIPPEWEWVKPIAAFIVTWGVPTLLTAIKQEPKK